MSPSWPRSWPEFVRVLRPGGHLVVSDSRGLLGYFASPVVKALPGGDFGYLPHRNRLTSDYLAAALPLGLQVPPLRRAPPPLPPDRSGNGPRYRAPRRAARHLVAAFLVPRRHQRRLPRQPRRDHLALPASSRRRAVAAAEQARNSKGNLDADVMAEANSTYRTPRSLARVWPDGRVRGANRK
jgi:hypothetical protein